MDAQGNGDERRDAGGTVAHGNGQGAEPRPPDRPDSDIRRICGELLSWALCFARADRGSVMLVDPMSGELRIEASVGLPSQAHAFSTARLAKRRASDWVVRNGRAATLQGQAEGQQFDPTARGDNIASALCLPLQAAQRTIGVLNLARLRPATWFNDDDLAGIAPRLIPLSGFVEQTLQTIWMREGWGLALRHDWLRASVSEWKTQRYDAAVSRRHGRVRRADLVERSVHPDGSVSVLLADLAGWGTAAMVDATILRELFLSLAGPRRPPSEVVDAINQCLVRRSDPLTACLWVAHLHPGGRVLSCVAGVPSPLVIGSNGDLLEVLREGGPPVGGLISPTYAQEHVQLLPGDKIVAFTDGLAGIAGDGGEGSPPESLLAVIRDLAGDSVVEFTRGLRDAALLDAGAKGPDDDMLVVGIHYRSHE